jgi:hypothetical protein
MAKEAPQVAMGTWRKKLQMVRYYARVHGSLTFFASQSPKLWRNCNKAKLRQSLGLPDAFSPLIRLRDLAHVALAAGHTRT